MSIMSFVGGIFVGTILGMFILALLVGPRN